MMLAVVKNRVVGVLAVIKPSWEQIIAVLLLAEFALMFQKIKIFIVLILLDVANLRCAGR